MSQRVAIRPYAPDIAFAPDGTLYVTYVNLVGAGNGPANPWLSTAWSSRRVYVDARLPALARVPAIAALVVLALAFAAVGLVTRRRQITQGTPN